MSLENLQKFMDGWIQKMQDQIPSGSRTLMPTWITILLPTAAIYSFCVHNYSIYSHVWTFPLWSATLILWKIFPFLLRMFIFFYQNCLPLSYWPSHYSYLLLLNECSVFSGYEAWVKMFELHGLGTPWAVQSLTWGSKQDMVIYSWRGCFQVKVL